MFYSHANIYGASTGPEKLEKFKSSLCEHVGEIVLVQGMNILFQGENVIRTNLNYSPFALPFSMSEINFRPFPQTYGALFASMGQRQSDSCSNIAFYVDRMAEAYLQREYRLDIENKIAQIVDSRKNVLYRDIPSILHWEDVWKDRFSDALHRKSSVSSEVVWSLFAYKDILSTYGVDVKELQIQDTNARPGN